MPKFDNKRADVLSCVIYLQSNRALAIRSAFLQSNFFHSLHSEQGDALFYGPITL